MQNTLQVFQFEEKSVRTLLIDGTIYFVITDVCKILSIANVGNATSRLDIDGVRLTDTIDSLGRNQKVTVNEPESPVLLRRG